MIERVKEDEDGYLFLDFTVSKKVHSDLSMNFKSRTLKRCAFTWHNVKVDFPFTVEELQTDKKKVIRFPNERKRGAYTLIVMTYIDAVRTVSIAMAQQIIEEDLEAVSGEEVQLNYGSLVKAFARYKKITKVPVGKDMRKRIFKDANELMSRQICPGKFKLG